MPNVGCAQGAEFQFSCAVLRAPARRISLKPLSINDCKGTFKQGVAGSNPARLISLQQLAGVPFPF